MIHLFDIIVVTKKVNPVNQTSESCPHIWWMVLRQVCPPQSGTGSMGKGKEMAVAPSDQKPMARTCTSIAVE